MNLFFVVGGPILIILAASLFITSRKLPKESRNLSYLAAAFCGIVGIASLYWGLV